MTQLARYIAISLTALAAVVAPAGLDAQVPMNTSYAALGPAYTWLDLERPTVKVRAGGLSFTGEAGLVMWGFFADVRLATGSLDYENADSSVTLVEGELMLGYRPLRWLALQLGPHVRKVETPSQSDDWVFWEGRLWLGATLVDRIAYSYAEGWVIFSASEPENATFDNGFGFEGGLFVKTTTLPVWLKAGYRIDRATFNSLGSADTVQQLLLLLGIDFNL